MKAREIKSKAIKKKIVDVARDLVMKQGYSKTTTRQIIETAGINNSTLYHFFRDKEDIFLSFMLDIYVKGIQHINATVTDDDDVFLYALHRVVEYKAVSKYRNLARTFFDLYTSWRISEKVITADVERCRLFFHPYTKKFTDDDFYVKTLALRGIRLNFYNECVHEGGTYFEKRWPFLVETDLRFFNLPKVRTQEIIEKIATVISKTSFKVYDIKI